MQNYPSFEENCIDDNEVRPEGQTSRTLASDHWVGSPFPPTKSVLIPQSVSPFRYSCPLAAVTNYQEPGGFKRYSLLFSFRSIDQKSNMGPTGLKSKVSAGLSFFWRFQGRIRFLAFSSFQKPLTFLANGPLLHLQSQQLPISLPPTPAFSSAHVHLAHIHLSEPSEPSGEL